MRQLLSLSKKLFFDRLTEVKEAPKTSNSTPKCISILERGELRGKSKHLAQQGLFTPQSPAVTDPLQGEPFILSEIVF